MKAIEIINQLQNTENMPEGVCQQLDELKYQFEKMEQEGKESGMRKIKYLVIHCTGTTQSATVKGILNYWKKPVEQGGKGWKNPGYHFLIKANGVVVQLHPISKPSNGVGGYNSNSIHVSYIGGEDHQDTRTDEQKVSLAAIIKGLSAMYPEAEILGHRDFPKVTKSCPCFDVGAEFNQLIK